MGAVIINSDHHLPMLAAPWPWSWERAVAAERNFRFFLLAGGGGAVSQMTAHHSHPSISRGQKLVQGEAGVPRGDKVVGCCSGLDRRRMLQDSTGDG